MATSRHLRSESSESNSSNGSSYQLILDHILTYPGSYEIPLRTMYQLNCAPRGTLNQPRSGTPSSSAGSSPITPQTPFPESTSTQTFTESLMAQMQQLPNQPKVLPPSFITNFLSRCFPARLTEVDFPQALTGLDYLKDLEARRRREVAAAMSRMDIAREALHAENDSFADKRPGVAAWAKSIEEKERKIDALYTQLYIGIRRWILINELSLVPFNKHNCVAMLNTLYPPVITSQPTFKLTREVLKNQRDGFFKYIQSVEKTGPHVLRTLMQQGKAPTDVNGWPAVTRTLSLYLQLANSMVNECSELSDVQQIPRPREPTKSSRQTRKADSGVSFNSVDVASSRSNSIVDPTSPTESTRPKTPTGGKHSTTLEKLARGLKTIGRSRTDATEMISDELFPPITSAHPQPEKPKGLRKMRSMGAIEGRKKADVSAAQNASFDADEMRRQRLRYEAGVAANQKFGRGVNQSHEI
ncbi:uncharacterized protein LTR77_006043 [Saxophila tyrrhenica]|uniref:Uncharacterized protein n=1 Tax=Saxophila tyrrhenica TaxID=1690608 RepID=A0AAV9P6R9_9PEZI|nr:hypothetical protein LTR77_006043 [Saxophila tyrrhenica]